MNPEEGRIDREKAQKRAKEKENKSKGKTNNDRRK